MKFHLCGTITIGKRLHGHQPHHAGPVIIETLEMFDQNAFHKKLLYV